MGWNEASGQLSPILFSTQRTPDPSEERKKKIGYKEAFLDPTMGGDLCSQTFKATPGYNARRNHRCTRSQDNAAVVKTRMVIGSGTKSHIFQTSQMSHGGSILRMLHQYHKPKIWKKMMIFPSLVIAKCRKFFKKNSSVRRKIFVGEVKKNCQRK